MTAKKEDFSKYRLMFKLFQWKSNSYIYIYLVKILPNNWEFKRLLRFSLKFLMHNNTHVYHQIKK
jgi:hypothetical protein